MRNRTALISPHEVAIVWLEDDFYAKYITIYNRKTRGDRLIINLGATLQSNVNTYGLL